MQFANDEMYCHSSSTVSAIYNTVLLMDHLWLRFADRRCPRGFELTRSDGYRTKGKSSSEQRWHLSETFPWKIEDNFHHDYWYSMFMELTTACTFYYLIAIDYLYPFFASCFLQSLLKFSISSSHSTSIQSLDFCSPIMHVAILTFGLTVLTLSVSGYPLAGISKKAKTAMTSVFNSNDAPNQ